MKQKTWALALAAGLLGAGGASQAALVDAGNGLVNDTVLDITWVANAGLSAESDQLNGVAIWQDLVDWADALIYGGYDDWRLASMSVAGGLPTGSAASVVDCETASEQDCRDNELGYMYAHYLPGNYGDNKTGNQTVGDVDLTGIQGLYWSGTEDALNPLDAWLFRTVNGLQDDFGKDFTLFGWAVRPGQIEIAAAPLPGTALLMALGFGVIAVSRRARRRLW